MRSAEMIAEKMSRPWSSVPSRKGICRPASQIGGVRLFIRLTLAGSKGSRREPGRQQRRRPTISRSAAAAAIVSFEDRKLASTSLSRNRPPQVVGWEA